MLEGTWSTEVEGASHGGTATRRPRSHRTHESARRDIVARLSAISLADLGRARDLDPAAEAEVTAVARVWLDLVDHGRHAVTWTAAAPVFREAFGEEEWEVGLRSVRTPLGRCRSRALRSRTSLEAFPGLPPGPYAVIRFESHFDGRPGVIETVTTCLGEDGRWRVAAYFTG
jgi:hypothetical protein